MATQAQLQTLHQLLNAVVETVRETGDHGAPGGVLYAALMNVGITLEQFETLMGALVEAGKLRRSGNLYFAVNGG